MCNSYIIAFTDEKGPDGPFSSVLGKTDLARLHRLTFTAGTNQFYPMRPRLFCQQAKATALASAGDRFKIQHKIAFRILVTAIKGFAELTGALDQFTALTLWAMHIFNHHRLLVHNKVAGRKIAATDKHAITAIFHRQRRATTWAWRVFQQLDDRAVVRVQILNIMTGRIVTAAQKWPVFAGSHHQFMLAQWTDLFVFWNGKQRLVRHNSVGQRTIMQYYRTVGRRKGNAGIYRRAFTTVLWLQLCLMQQAGRFFKNQIFHLSISGFMAWRVKQHH